MRTRRAGRRRSAVTSFLTAGLLAATVLALGCGRGAGSGAPDAPRIEKAQWGPIEAVLRFEPGQVFMDRDQVLTVTVTAPETMDIELPPLLDRLEGFIVSGTLDREPLKEGGRVRTERGLLLTPVLADEYRLAPFAVRYTDRSVTPPLTGWFPTPAVTLSRVAPNSAPKGDIPGEIPLKPVPPAPGTLLTYAGVALGIAALIAAIVYALRRVRHEIQLRRLTPRERALKELEILLSRDFIRRGLIKEFYLELTMIVRRYIERQHKVRAPEQTTEEFLAAISADPRFAGATAARLRRFLEAADMVKFAAYRPGAPDIEAASGTARDYIEHDTAAAGPPGKGA